MSKVNSGIFRRCKLYKAYNCIVVSVAEFYSTVRQGWDKRAEDLQNVTVLSVGGGNLDFQVRSGLTALSCPIDDFNKISVVVGLLAISFWKVFFFVKYINLELLKET